ncbi:UAA transporter [Phytophthora cactorum]|nr:UAA transporter [Phytophthora cactorum]
MGRTVLYASSPRDSSILNLLICIGGSTCATSAMASSRRKCTLSTIPSSTMPQNLHMCIILPSFTYRSPSGDKFTSTLFMLFPTPPPSCGNPSVRACHWPIRHDSRRLPGAMLCSNEALKHVSFPTQALGKSCKMIPVMLMGVLIRRKKYTLRDYICVVVITTGIAHAERENSTYGLLLLFLSLTLDGISGPKQEEIAHQLRPSVHQQMLNTNIWAVVYTALEGFFFCMENPAILNSVFYFSVCSALGQNFIYFTIQQFSALTCTTITTTRKFFTILFSVVWYGHELSLMSWLGVAVVFIGLGWELSSKYQKYQAQSAKLT